MLNVFKILTLDNNPFYIYFTHLLQNITSNITSQFLLDNLTLSTI